MEQISPVTTQDVDTRDPVKVSWKHITAFRLSRHRLIGRAASNRLIEVSGEMGGAQAQLLLAGQMSLGTRVRDITSVDVDHALWRDRTLVKAWCMRRTMFLVPSADLAFFSRGSALRPEREVRWVLNKGVPEKKLEELLAAVLDALDEPVTQSKMAEKVAKSLGIRIRNRSGGTGWGERRKVPWLDFGYIPLPANYLLHIAGARGVYCCGPGEGNGSTFVRADRWIPHWKDVPQATAERKLLLRYLGAYGPATPLDFATWTGMTVMDAKRIWMTAEDATAPVDAEGTRAWILRDDIDDMLDSETDGPNVRLLPYFDSFLLGHKSHRNVVGPDEHGRVFRPQGWVSPVLLVDGRAAGVWSYARKNKKFEAAIRPFRSISKRVESTAREEAASHGRFLGASEIEVHLA